jgi:uncharacterized protein
MANPTPELADKKRGQSWAWRIARRLIRFVAISYVLVCAAMYFLQTKLIFPGANTQGAREARVFPGVKEELVDLKAGDGTAIKGLFCAVNSTKNAVNSTKNRVETGIPAQNPISGRQGGPESDKSTYSTTYALADNGGELARRPVVLFFYGNAECMADCEEQVALFRDLGYHVMLVDYEGYGLSGGKPSEQGCYAAAEAGYEYVLNRPDVDRRKIVAAGWSLGGGVAVELVYRHRGDGTMAGLMTFCTFTSLGDVAQGAVPVLPVKLLLRHRFESAEKMKELALPWFAGHGRGDRVVPFSHLAKLTGAYGGEKGNLTVFESGSDHNDFFEASAGVREAMAGFLARATK